MFGTSRSLPSRLVRGAIAGAVGTTVLNTVTYSDMLLRGRGSSGAPAKVAGNLAADLGLNALRTDNDDPKAQHRQSAAGALLGYGTGVGIGAAYGMLRRTSGHAHPLRDGVLLGLAAMAASDTPIALTGVSDPRSWSPSAWLTDIIPHMAYGLATACTFNRRGAG